MIEMIEELEQRRLLTALPVSGISNNETFFTFRKTSTGQYYIAQPSRVNSTSYAYSDGNDIGGTSGVTLANVVSGCAISPTASGTTDIVGWVNDDYSFTANTSSAFFLIGGEIDGHMIKAWPRIDKEMMVIHNGNQAYIRNLLIAGRNVAVGGVADGTWDGPGLWSTAVQSWDHIFGEELVIGYAVNSDLPLGQVSTFGGRSVGSSDILIRTTINGDADLDGQCGDNDVTIIGGFYDHGVTTTFNWLNGDFNFDGEVNDTDVTIIGGFYGHSWAHP